MERRTFLAMLPASLLAASHAAEAQQGKHVIGVLNLGFADSQRSSWDAFRQGLRERGYIEGDSVAIEFRSADGEADRLPALTAELLALKVKVIVTAGTTSVQAAKSATSTTPIVIAAGADPVAMNFAQSLARPGANITGLSILAGEIAQKRLELLRRAVPHAKVAAFLLQSANPGNAIFVKATTEAGQSLGLRVQVLQVRTPDELEQAFAAMVTVKADALLVVEDPIFLAHAKKIADLALRHRLPTMLGNRLYVHAGGLMAYGLAYDDLWRRAAGYVDRILKGAKPAEMPIEQPNKFDLIINLKTAKALGLTIPRTLLLQADQVVE